MFCIKCGKELRDEKSNFCSYCGAKVERQINNIKVEEVKQENNSYNTYKPDVVKLNDNNDIKEEVNGDKFFVKLVVGAIALFIMGIIVLFVTSILLMQSGLRDLEKFERNYKSPKIESHFEIVNPKIGD